MSLPDLGLSHAHMNNFIDELGYDCAKQLKLFDDIFLKLSDEQNKVYNMINDAVINDTSGDFYCLRFWSLLPASLCLKELVVLNVTSNGIASLLLSGGITAHSIFAISLNPTEFMTCTIPIDSDLAELVKLSKLIICDDRSDDGVRSMRDVVRCNLEKPFRGKVVVFGGNFKQILPVIVGAGRDEAVMAAINSSKLWRKIAVLTLTKNIRFLRSINNADSQELESFSKWILDIGE